MTGPTTGPLTCSKINLATWPVTGSSTGNATGTATGLSTGLV